MAKPHISIHMRCRSFRDVALREQANDRASVESAALVPSVEEDGDSRVLQNFVILLPDHVIVRNRAPLPLHTAHKTSHWVNTSREVERFYGC